MFMLGEREMLWEHEFERRVFSQLLRVHPNYHECYYVSIQTVRTCFPFLLGNSVTKKELGNTSFTLMIKM